MRPLLFIFASLALKIQYVLKLFLRHLWKRLQYIPLIWQKANGISNLNSIFKSFFKPASSILKRFPKAARSSMNGFLKGAQNCLVNPSGFWKLAFSHWQLSQALMALAAISKTLIINKLFPRDSCKTNVKYLRKCEVQKCPSAVLQRGTYLFNFQELIWTIPITTGSRMRSGVESF
jgi:hypothetical protein